ncbi:MAG: sulfite exporter TauE/SafE family protein [Synechococcales bacterium]|nr:sulfite exporter TauE/SafE family protein [Synechococcales bacterium]
MGHFKGYRWHHVVLAGLGVLVIYFLSGTPSQAHWADLAVADVKIDRRASDRTAAEMVLTVPTGLLGGADDNQDGQLSAQEVNDHRTMLQAKLGEKVRLLDDRNQPGTLQVEPSELSALPQQLRNSSNSHSTLKLTYTWQGAIAGLKMQYRLFEPGVSTARCFTTVTQTIAQASDSARHRSSPAINNVIFSPEQQEINLIAQSPFHFTPDLTGGLWVTLLAAFVWGAAHAMSPGHGKTLVGAYLMGERATAYHALFLGFTTTVTHTLGVFTLGVVTLWASRSVLPEQVFPWLSLASGILVIMIGGNLLRDRLRFGYRGFKLNSQTHHHSIDHSHTHHDHPHHDYPHPHPHTHSHHLHEYDLQHHYTHNESTILASNYSLADDVHAHDHSHHHSHSHHSHLPPGADGTPVRWQSLLALGISGGLIPCPSALVLLLSAIALGQIGYGLLLVLAFSLGLATVLTSLGLLLVYAKQLFNHRLVRQLSVQRSVPLRRIVNFIPTLTACIITLMGVGISLQALLQMRTIHL